MRDIKVTETKYYRRCIFSGGGLSRNTTRRKMSFRECEITRRKLARCISDVRKITALEGKRKKG